MKNYIFFSICFLLIPFKLHSQDKIYKTNGEILKCKISKTDSARIYYSFTRNDKSYSSSINRNEVSDFKYSWQFKKDSIPTKPKDPTNYICNLSLDLGGIITYGPAFLMELYAQDKDGKFGIGLYTGLRVNNIGFIYNTDHIGSWDELSLTIPVGFKLYVKTRTKADGFFLGPHFEFFKSYGENVSFLGGELGYKWQFKNRMTLELSDWAGGMWWWRPVVGESGYQKPTYIILYMISIKLGVSLGH
jgi:hypothetical protein